MHDGITLEKMGIPTVAIVSDAFIGNAKTMARLSGIPDYPFLAVPHPVSSLDKKGIEDLVATYFPTILRLLLEQPSIPERE